MLALAASLNPPELGSRSRHTPSGFGNVVSRLPHACTGMQPRFARVSCVERAPPRRSWSPFVFRFPPFGPSVAFYQNDAPYLLDSCKFAKAFGFTGTPTAE
jgi:hypothetical protein